MSRSRNQGIGNEDALDVLERQNVAILELFDQLDCSTGPAVGSRYDHGNQGKRLIRRLSLREAAKADVVHVLGASAQRSELRDRLAGAVPDRRAAINLLDQMGRGVRPIDLNKTQDFDGAVEKLRQIIVPEIEWELTDGIRCLRESLPEGQRVRLHSARYIRRHAPTKLDPKQFRSRERIRVASWILTVWDRLADLPRPVKGARVD